jgi:hypothetical protein
VFHDFTPLSVFLIAFVLRLHQQLKLGINLSVSHRNYL